MRTITFAAVTFLVFCLIGFLRFYKLGVLPPGLTKDESYYGYDAYSILQTGRDIWGKSYPLLFRSTGEYKLDLTYFIVPAVASFGLNELAVRLPSAVFGFGTLVILFLTLEILFRRRGLALLATLIFALSPWAFGMSRLFYESNVGLFFMAGGIYGVVSRRLPFAAVFFALSSYLYNPYRYIGASLLTLALILLPVPKSKTIKALFLFGLLLLPLLLSSPSGASTQRLAQEWRLRQSDYALVVNDMRAKCHTQIESAYVDKLCYALWNKPILYAGGIARASFRALSPELLFMTTDNEYIIPKGYGMYLSYLLPFYILGLCWLFGFVNLTPKSRSLRLYLILALCILTVIVSSPGSLELYRYPVTMYLVFLLIAAGLMIGMTLVSQLPRLSRSLVIALVIVAGLFQQAKYLTTYALYSHSLPLLFASDAREIFTYLESKRDYDFIVDKKFHGPITAAFFWKIDPRDFQHNIVWTDPDPWGFVNAYRLDNLHSQTYTIEALLCKKHQNPFVPIKAVVIDDPGKYASLASLKTYDYSGTLNLHAVYDIDELYPQVLTQFPSDLCSL